MNAIKMGSEAFIELGGVRAPITVCTNDLEDIGIDSVVYMNDGSIRLEIDKRTLPKPVYEMSADDIAVEICYDDAPDVAKRLLHGLSAERIIDVVTAVLDRESHSVQMHAIQAIAELSRG